MSRSKAAYVDVAVTLYDRGWESADVAAQVRAEDWSARRPQPPTMRTSSRWWKGRRSAWRLGM